MIHNGGKVGAYIVGELIRTKMKVVINPFPEGKGIIFKAHKLATHFLYGSEQYKQLRNIVNALSEVPGGVVQSLYGTQRHSDLCMPVPIVIY